MKYTTGLLISCIILAAIATGCKTSQSADPIITGQKPAMPSGIPDLTRGEGPDPAKTQGPHHLISSTCRAWVYRDANGSAANSRQILLTWVFSDKPVGRSLKKGDVILGINGKYFSGYPIDQFRQGQLEAIKTEGAFTVILWRKGWEKERLVTVELWFKALDFTKGDTPGTACDWTLGPTGARGWMQGRYNESYGARQIIITQVHKGSPADGILRKGDVILGLDGKKFDSDCRRAFGRAITEAETAGGKGEVNLVRWRPSDPAVRTEGTTENVTMKIPVMGSYSTTTPWNCEKTQRILENACKYIVENDIINKGKKGKPAEKAFAALGLLSTGKEEYLKIVKEFVYNLAERVEESKKAGKRPPNWCYGAWGSGYHNILLCEYYLLTKDARVLPAIEIYGNFVAEGQSGVGSWGHGMASPNHGRIGGYGAMNQASTICWMSLMLAKRCGVTSPEIEAAIVRGKIYLDHFIDRTYVPYGDGVITTPRLHDDNGKSSAAACAYSILNDERGTDYFSKMSIASWAVREFGHTGNPWSMLWGPLGSVRAGQEASSEFLKTQSWYFDMGRRWDGGFTYDGKMGYRSGFDYDTDERKGSAENQYYGQDMTGIRILMYTLPSKRLVIQGKDTLTITAEKNEIPELMEAGRPAPASIEFQAGNIKFLKDKYENTPTDDLLKLLKSWSPVVRQQAATTLAKRNDNVVDRLRNKLKSTDRYERYGALMAIRELEANDKATGMTDDLLPLLETDDEAQFTYAAFAVSATKDPKGANALLKLAMQEFPSDPNDYHLRVIGESLFKRPGALSQSIDGVDRKILIPAAARLMQCKGGTTRNYTATSIMPALTVDEITDMWPVLTKSLNNYALTEVAVGTAGQSEIAETFARLKIKEALPHLFEYVQKQKGHGSQKRHQQLLGFVKAYGVYAKPLIPEMETYLEALKNNEVRDTHFCTNLAPHLEAAIKAIKETTDKPELISIGK